MATGMGPDYWCHRCHEAVHVSPAELMACPRCSEGFIEQIRDRSAPPPPPRLFGLFSDGNARRGRRRSHFRDRDDEDAEGGPRLVVVGHSAIMELMQALGSSDRTTADDNDNDDDDDDDDADADGERRSELLPPSERGGSDGGLNVTLVLQRRVRGGLEENLGILFESEGRGDRGFRSSIGGLPRSLGDYFIGPGLDLLIQRLAENDPNRYGTPPASKSAVDAMPAVKISEEHLRSDFNQCVVCMEEFELGCETRQMPCKHLYHAECIFPWLKLHSSCPVCRFQLPSETDTSEKKAATLQDESTTSSSSPQDNASNNNGASSSSGAAPSSSRRSPWRWNFFNSHSDNTDGQGSGSASDPSR
ncbi:hypothetical protein KI387_038235, partial [Taxus chinensis]